MTGLSRSLITDWPEGDVGCTYIGIEGDGFMAAVTVMVAKINEELLICEVQWGRP